MDNINNRIKLYLSITLWIFFIIIFNTITTKLESLKNENKILKWQISNFYNNNKNYSNLQKRENNKKSNMLISIIKDHFDNEDISVTLKKEDVITINISYSNFDQIIAKIYTIHRNINDIIKIHSIEIEKNQKKNNIIIEYSIQ